MSADDADPPPAPEAAFAALGNETRLAVLRTLGAADGPLAFTELQRRVGYETAGNFSYHLEQLCGHFIRQTDEGYRLAQAGERIVEAVLSGAITEAPSIDRTRIDRNCPYCGHPVELSYAQDRVSAYCTECAGVYSGSKGSEGSPDEGPSGLLGHLPFPPAGVQGRSVQAIERAAWTWGVRDMIALANGVCPRCAANLQQTPEWCSDHGDSDGLCPTCRSRHAVQLRSRCENCLFDHEGAFVLKFMTNTAFLSFVTDHGLNPVTDHWEFGWEYTETVDSTDPFEARFEFEIGGDVLTLTVDETLTVSRVGPDESMA